MDGLIVVNAIVAILGGILAASAMILARKPDAKQLIDKLTPYQALIGVGMIALGVINFLRILGYLTDVFKVNLMLASALLALLLTSVALGGLFGMPQITKWIPGESSAEQKALELTRKVAPYQGILGLVAIVASLMTLLYQFKILSWAG
jgi:hypothetical protein